MIPASLREVVEGRLDICTWGNLCTDISKTSKRLVRFLCAEVLYSIWQQPQQQYRLHLVDPD